MFDFSLLISPFFQTIYMVAASGFLTCLFGFSLGILLFITRPNQIYARHRLNQFLNVLVSTLRSIPFIILMIALIPFTRWLVGTSIGTTAAIVPLTLCAIPFLGKVIQTTLQEIPFGLIEASQSMGASTQQIILKILIPESLPGIIHAITLTLINLVAYSAMAGAIGGGGLGDLAIRYGYQRFDTNVMFFTVIILIVLVQVTQYLGERCAKRLKR